MEESIRVTKWPLKNCIFLRLYLYKALLNMKLTLHLHHFEQLKENNHSHIAKKHVFAVFINSIYNELFNSNSI